MLKTSSEWPHSCNIVALLHSMFSRLARKLKRLSTEAAVSNSYAQSKSHRHQTNSFYILLSSGLQHDKSRQGKQQHIQASAMASGQASPSVAQFLGRSASSLHLRWETQHMPCA
jgi:hypothetical protein